MDAYPSLITAAISIDANYVRPQNLYLHGTASCSIENSSDFIGTRTMTGAMVSIWVFWDLVIASYESTVSNISYEWIGEAPTGTLEDVDPFYFYNPGAVIGFNPTLHSVEVSVDHGSIIDASVVRTQSITGGETIQFVGVFNKPGDLLTNYYYSGSCDVGYSITASKNEPAHWGAASPVNIYLSYQCSVNGALAGNEDGKLTKNESSGKLSRHRNEFSFMIGQNQLFPHDQFGNGWAVKDYYTFPGGLGDNELSLIRRDMDIGIIANVSGHVHLGP